MAVTEFQEVSQKTEYPCPSTVKTNMLNPFLENQKVYALLQQIPSGRVCSYAAMASALNSSPRAVGGALRRNPFAPEVVSPVASERASPSKHLNISIHQMAGADTFLSFACSPVTAASRLMALLGVSWAIGRRLRVGRIRLPSWRC